MVRIRPERMPSGASKKLHPRNIGSYKILKKIGSNAYVPDLPSDSGVSSISTLRILRSTVVMIMMEKLKGRLLLYLLILHLLMQLLMCLMIKLFPLVKEVFKSSMSAERNVLSPMLRGSLQ